MEKVSHSLILLMIVAAIYVAVQSIVWTVNSNLPLSTVLYVGAIMIILVVLIIILAKVIW